MFTVLPPSQPRWLVQVGHGLLDELSKAAGDSLATHHAPHPPCHPAVDARIAGFQKIEEKPSLKDAKQSNVLADECAF